MLSSVVEACAFATSMMYSLEFSKTPVAPGLNPYGLLSLPLDRAIPEWHRRIFANVVSEAVDWATVGVLNMPASLIDEFGKFAATFKFNREGCNHLDCFGYTDFEARVCNFIGSGETVLETPAGPLVACRPSCFYPNHFVPSNEHVYFDNKLKLCRLGLSEYRKICLIPSSRDGKLAHIPPLHWDTQDQKCNLTKAYCEASQGVDFVNGDCVLRKGQGVLEFVFGRNLVRTLKLQGRDANRQTRVESAWETALANARAKQNSSANTRNVHVKSSYFDNENVLLRGVSYIITSRYKEGEDTRKVNSVQIKDLHKNGDSRDLEYISGGEHLDFSTSQKGFEAFPELNAVQSVTAMLGIVLGMALARKVGTKALAAAAVASANISEAIAAKYLLETSVERGAFRLGALMVARTVGIVAAESASVSLATAAASVNPVCYAVEIVMILSALWDIFDHRYDNVLRKESLETARNVFVKHWNKTRGFIEKDTGKMAIVELLPTQVYVRMYGNFLDVKSSRYSEKRLRTFIYYVDKYCDAISEKNYSEVNFSRMNKAHINHLSYTYRNALLSTVVKKVESGNKSISVDGKEFVQSCSSNKIFSSKPYISSALLSVSVGLCAVSFLMSSTVHGKRTGHPLSTFGRMSFLVFYALGVLISCMFAYSVSSLFSRQAMCNNSKKRWQIK